ncbi:bifunctional DNA primase/polymerase [Streptomyces aidingensis]|uniref:Bifunctional DNA primase/polymerase, N-terminal n=1 Tax=Streptomyces aidingensis TaxID=910347 RepID=A0A1I1P061_9ACTN|nr:bifunctional DNA primase/polymerase [Streptomyces aidingensis]SFD00363.1 Bifunctional DNA primase/polymerase, N-terminal [Streptomyces aidingensis]
MGFTIGSGLREVRELRLVTGRPRRARRGGHAPQATAAAEYTARWGWDVRPGARARRFPGGRVECSCGADCGAPGAHPLPAGEVIPAGSSPAQAVRAWTRTPGAAVLLPTGRMFDVIEVPAGAGRRALLRMERMGLPLGPVAESPAGRMWFFVAPGAAGEVPRLQHRMGWPDGLPDRLGLRVLGPGCHVPAPPSDHGGRGHVRWLRPPSPEAAARPPQARLLLGALAYACHTRAGTGGAPPHGPPLGPLVGPRG